MSASAKYSVLPLSGQDIAPAIAIAQKSPLEYAAGLAKAGRKFGQMPGDAPAALTALAQVSASNPSLPSVLQQVGEAHMPNGMETISQKQLKEAVGEIAVSLGMVDQPKLAESIFPSIRSKSKASARAPK